MEKFIYKILKIAVEKVFNGSFILLVFD